MGLDRIKDTLKYTKDVNHNMVKIRALKIMIADLDMLVLTAPDLKGFLNKCEIDLGRIETEEASKEEKKKQEQQHEWEGAAEDWIEWPNFQFY